MGQTATKCMSSSQVLNSVIPNNFNEKSIDSATSLKHKKAKKRKWKKICPLASTPYIVVTKMPIKDDNKNISKASNRMDSAYSIQNILDCTNHTADERVENSCDKSHISEPTVCKNTQKCAQNVMELAEKDPDFLVDWEVFVEGYGFGYCIDGNKYGKDQCPEVTIKVFFHHRRFTALRFNYCFMFIL